MAPAPTHSVQQERMGPVALRHVHSVQQERIIDIVRSRGTAACSQRPLSAAEFGYLYYGGFRLHPREPRCRWSFLAGIECTTLHRLTTRTTPNPARTHPPHPTPAAIPPAPIGRTALIEQHPHPAPPYRKRNTHQSRRSQHGHIHAPRAPMDPVPLWLGGIWDRA